MISLTLQKKLLELNFFQERWRAGELPQRLNQMLAIIHKPLQILLSSEK